MPSKINRIPESDSEKKRQKIETDKQSTDNRQFRPCAPLIHRTTGGGRVLQPHTIPKGRSTLSPAGSKCRIVITGLKMGNKYSDLCSANDRPGKTVPVL
jgi:hypothetical protein